MRKWFLQIATRFEEACRTESRTFATLTGLAKSDIRVHRTIQTRPKELLPHTVIGA